MARPVNADAAPNPVSRLQIASVSKYGAPPGAAAAFRQSAPAENPADGPRQNR